MAATPEEKAIILNNQSLIQQIMSGTVAITALSGTQKRQVIENVFPNGVAIDVNDPNIKVGDSVFGEKAGINSGKWFFGVVTTAPPTADGHITFKYRVI
ncbi:hypothetical protein J0X14_14190 [Muricauda sp. CAU 1633]|uniref:hypothetical protein n=1 Tax=Allomuricauda sp. CAU 1633 TaxID=2816036 RepID=UPI001A903035|nr:hypothetical protein [Muricauda sp. CAU 1633]MBO0323454.1 hypothetical protein [Muricauda sp. CAU 1633]